MGVLLHTFLPGRPVLLYSPHYVICRNCWIAQRWKIYSVSHTDQEAGGL